MVDLLVYTNHRMGDMYCNTPFPHNVLSIVTVLIFFWGRFFFREVSVNDDIAVKLIVFCTRKCLREEVDSRDTFNVYLLDPYWSQKKRILYTPFFWHSIGWVQIFYLFIFIWEVRIRHWSRNLSQKFYRDVLMKRNPNWCIVAFCWSEIQIDVSSHFDEAKSKSMYRRILMKRNLNRCIVAFW